MREKTRRLAHHHLHAHYYPTTSALNLAAARVTAAAVAVRSVAHAAGMPGVRHATPPYPCMLACMCTLYPANPNASVHDDGTHACNGQLTGATCEIPEMALVLR